MSDDSSHVGRTIEDIKQQIADKIEEAKRLLLTVNTLEGMIGAQPSSLFELLGDDDPAPQQMANQPRANNTANPRSIGSSRQIKPDQFLGEQPLDAAKKYIGLVGHAVHFDEIADAVQRGGAAIKGADWREKLETSLLKSVYELVKVQDKTFGLIRFYSDEQIKGLRGTRKSPEPKKRPKAKRPKPPAAKASQSERKAESEKPERAIEKPKATAAVDDHIH